MGLEVRSLVEVSMTNGASMRSFFHVQDFVDGQCA